MSKGSRIGPEANLKVLEFSVEKGLENEYASQSVSKGSRIGSGRT